MLHFTTLSLHMHGTSSILFSPKKLLSDLIYYIISLPPSLSLCLSVSRTIFQTPRSQISKHTNTPPQNSTQLPPPRSPRNIQPDPTTPSARRHLRPPLERYQARRIPRAVLGGSRRAAKRYGVAVAEHGWGAGAQVQGGRGGGEEDGEGWRVGWDGGEEECE